MGEALIAIDVGNSRVKLGRFAAPTDLLPEPFDTLAGTIDELESGSLRAWLGNQVGESPRVVIASVCQDASQRVAKLMDCPCEFLSAVRFPIVLRIEHPERLGADRAAAAVAANQLRRPDRPAIVVDVGTAITVDRIGPDGAFEGGAILPGPRLAATALAERTDALPLSTIADLDRSPDPVGRSTETALLAGLYWGAIGAVRELIARQCDTLTTSPQVFLTGGASPSIARLIGGPDYTVRHVEHLTLAGIAHASQG